MQFRGKHVVLLIFLAATLMGGYAWWHAYHRGKRSLEAWGSDVAVLIRYAPTVELWELTEVTGGDGDGEADLHLRGRRFAISRRVDISDTRGLVHARHALVEDASFLWNANADSSAEVGVGDWKFALHFAGPDDRATVAFDLQQGRLLEANRERLIEPRLKPTLVKAYTEKAQDWSNREGP